MKEAVSAMTKRWPSDVLPSVGRLLKQDPGINQGMGPGIIQPACRFHFQDIRNQEPTWPGIQILDT